ncbi:unnamed protein product [Gadus morhua 'NCC']
MVGPPSELTVGSRIQIILHITRNLCSRWTVHPRICSRCRSLTQEPFPDRHGEHCSPRSTCRISAASATLPATRRPNPSPDPLHTAASVMVSSGLPPVARIPLRRQEQNKTMMGVGLPEGRGAPCVPPDGGTANSARLKIAR